MTPLQMHCDTYRSGCGAVECERANRIVFGRGDIPCDVLFIGEAPGDAENAFGVPFVGLAGKLLDEIIAGSIPKGIRYALTNMVACRPTEEDGDKAAMPPDVQVRSCFARLLDFVYIAAPKLIVCVGTVARDYLDTKRRGHLPLPLLCASCKKIQSDAFESTTDIPYHCHDVLNHQEEGIEIPRVFILHPSAMLRQDELGKENRKYEAETTIMNAVEDVLLFPPTEIPTRSSPKDDIPF